MKQLRFGLEPKLLEYGVSYFLPCHRLIRVQKAQIVELPLLIDHQQINIKKHLNRWILIKFCVHGLVLYLFDMTNQLSKPAHSLLSMLQHTLFGSRKKQTVTGSVLLTLLCLIFIRSRRPHSINIKVKANKKGKGNVDSVFLQRIKFLIKVVIPQWNCIQVFYLFLLTIFLIFRTFLSIYIASVNGMIVKSIIKKDLSHFVKKIATLGLIAVPASFVNSYLDYLNKSLAINFRKRLTNYYHDSYLKDMVFYRLTGLDSRISNPDQRLTTDIEKWANSLSVIYSNFSKPVLDIILFSRKLSELVGYSGPLVVILWYFFSGLFIKMVSPSFGKLTAIQQKLQGNYRTSQSDLVNHAEEIAFYRGNSWQYSRIDKNFGDLIRHSTNIINKKMFMGIFDSILVKYGALMVGYGVLGIPVFGSGSAQYLSTIKSDAGAITRDYVRNSSLLINLAKAIGRLVISYKQIQQLAGYTTLVFQMNEVLEDLSEGKYVRTQIVGQKDRKQLKSVSNLNQINKGRLVETDNQIVFNHVSVVSPNGDVLIETLNFAISAGMNCIITGPNGCGKSSLFRVLSGLWPLTEGQLSRPSVQKLFYIPQRPYLPCGSLRDQIIYPHNKLQMLRKRYQDKDLQTLLESVKLAYLVQRQGGFDVCNDWNDVLSGGQKQRIAMARLFYHKPMFAILDQCTSAVSMDVQAILYNTAKRMGITLFTVSHRQTLQKFHDYKLAFDGEGKCQFSRIQHEAHK